MRDSIADAIETAGLGVVRRQLHLARAVRHLFAPGLPPEGPPVPPGSPLTLDELLGSAPPAISPVVAPLRPGVERWEFATPVPSGIAKNDRVRMTRFAPTGGGPVAKRPVLIAHAWLLWWWNRVWFDQFCRNLASRGVIVYLPELPWHLSRTPRGCLSGEYAVGTDPRRATAFVLQALGELRAIAAHCVARGEGYPVIAGVSLGGWIAGLAVACGETRAGAVLGVPVLDAADAVAHSPMLKQLRERVEERTAADGGQVARHSLAGVLPLDVATNRQLPPAAAAAPLIVLAAARDRVARPVVLERARLLWPNARVEVAAHGHISSVATSWLRRRMAEETSALARV